MKKKAQPVNNSVEEAKVAKYFLVPEKIVNIDDIRLLFVALMSSVNVQEDKEPTVIKLLKERGLLKIAQ